MGLGEGRVSEQFSVVVPGWPVWWQVCAWARVMCHDFVVMCMCVCVYIREPTFSCVTATLCFC